MITTNWSVRPGAVCSGTNYEKGHSLYDYALTAAAANVATIVSLLGSYLVEINMSCSCL